MERIDLGAVVYRSPEAAFDFLLDFPGYARYSEHLQGVDQLGPGGEGTQYRLHFSWWKLSYTVHSEVTAVERPERIEWRVRRHVDASGWWLVEPASVPPDAPDDVEAAAEVRFVAEFDPTSVRTGAIGLPRFVPFGAVVDRVRPALVREAERVVERAVADLEGQRRDVDLVVHDRPDKA